MAGAKKQARLLTEEPARHSQPVRHGPFGYGPFGYGPFGYGPVRYGPVTTNAGPAASGS